jgi:hypothetical protein
VWGRKSLAHLGEPPRGGRRATRWLRQLRNGQKRRVEAGTNGKAPAGSALVGAPVGAAPAGAGGGAPAAETKAPKTLAGVYVQTPPELRGRLEEVAAKAGVTPQVWVRDHLAREWGVVLPPVTKRVKYASEDEKKTALKERSKAKNELIKKLLAEYQAAQAGGGLETLRNRRAPQHEGRTVGSVVRRERLAWHESVGRGALLCQSSSAFCAARTLCSAQNLS